MTPQSPGGGHDPEVIKIALMMLIAVFGSITATLMKHEGQGLTLSQLIGIALYKSVIGAFAGLMAGLIASHLHWGPELSYAFAGLAGLAGKEGLDIAIKKYKERLEKA